MKNILIEDTSDPYPKIKAVLTPAQIQSRHRHFKKKAIIWYEQITGVKIKHLMKLIKIKEESCDTELK